MQFTPNENFYCPETKSQYLVGLNYTVNAGNTLLATLAMKWLVERKVRLSGTGSPIQGE